MVDSQGSFLTCDYFIFQPHVIFCAEKTPIIQHPPKFLDILRILRDNKHHDKRPTKDKTFLRTTLTKAEKLYKDYSKCLTEFKNAKKPKKRDKEQKLEDMYQSLANFADAKKNELDGMLGKQRDIPQPTVSIWDKDLYLY